MPVRPVGLLVTASPRAALTRLIASIPNLLTDVATPTFIRDPSASVRLRTPHEVADRIASVLPALLAAEGYAVVELPRIEPDGFGGWSVRVPMSDRPWADGEIYLDPTGRVALANIAPRVPPADVPTLAAALLAVHTALSNQRHRQP